MVMDKVNKNKHINQRKPRKPNTLAEQMKIKRFDPVELKAWNSLFPDVKFKNKKHNSHKIFDGKVQDDPKPRPPPKEEYDIEKQQKPNLHKKPKPKNPDVFQSPKKEKQKKIKN
tara:strand:+ start:489 stop:830 length:342 start_codon:yes stop_codon:yes gene_type:complete